MNETFEIGFYEFMRSEMGNLRDEFRNALGGLEARMDKRLTESEARTEKRFDKLENDVGLRFNKLEEEVRWPRRIAIGGVITTVLAVFFAIIGFRGII